MKNVISRWWHEWNDLFIALAIACIVVGIIIWLGIGSSGNLNYVKERSEIRFQELNYEIIGYEGYRFGFWGYNDFGGAHVWYLLKKNPDNGIIYKGSLQRWGDEIHLMQLKAVDAIKP